MGEFLSYTITILVVSGSFIGAFVLGKYYRKSNLYVSQLEAKESVFDRDKELLEGIRLEIQKETLENVSKELHDNIGHSLTLIKMELENIELKSPDDLKLELKEVGLMLSHLRDDVRNIFSSIKSIGDSALFSDALKNEIRRVEKSSSLVITLDILGTERTFRIKERLLLFRMCQEIFQNIIKHAQASEVKVTIAFAKDSFVIRISDNGRGFQLEEVMQKGMGLQNLSDRAKIIDAELKITSEQGNGTTVEILKSN